MAMIGTYNPYSDYRVQPAPAYRRGRGLREGGLLGDYISQARGTVQDIEAGAEGLAGRGAWAEPLAQEGITRAVRGEGWGPAEYARAKGRVTRGFQAQTGILAGKGARGGYFSRSSTAQAAGGQPAAALGMGLSNLEAEREAASRQERATGLSALTSTLPGLMASARRPEEAYGAFLGQYIGGTPLAGGQGRGRSRGPGRLVSPYA